jgi:alkanesulfonate monooxygenase SsuD/methylene tetrahydromethanopterin reductase-like flavin-dependent oxidoreductase (luciferase family)
MKFGAMDHLDLSNSLSQADHYEDRLKLGEMFDRAGFHCFHVTEHHFTPLGGCSSPSVFLSALAQRVKQMRVGTLVYAVPAHHPIKLLEEICMLDQMSRGRLDIGFGRGSVPEELAYLGVDTKAAREIYQEGVEIIEQGLRDGHVDYEGKHFTYRDVPLHLKPYQKPMPPIWYGVHSTESALSAARSRFHLVVNEDTKICAKYIAEYRDELEATGYDGPEPFTGLARTLVVADTDEKAREIAHRAYLVFQSNFTWMHRRFGRVPQHWGIDLTFDKLVPTGRCIAGSPETVARELEHQHRTTGANYAVLRFSFGDMSFAEMSRSIELFSTQVMPVLARVPELA